MGNEALFRPKTNNDKNLQEFFENLQKSIHDLADKTDLILNSPTSSVDTEKLIAEISPMIASQIKKTDDDFPEKIKEMFATTKYEYECIQKLVHQNTEGFKELKKISAHFFEDVTKGIEKIDVKIQGNSQNNTTTNQSVKEPLNPKNLIAQIVPEIT